MTFPAAAIAYILREKARLIRLAEDQQRLLDIADDIDAMADALLARVEPQSAQTTFVDPKSVQGQQAIRNAAFLAPTTQGDPVPDSAEDIESHPWKATSRVEPQDKTAPSHVHEWTYQPVVNAMFCRCGDRVDCDHRLPGALARVEPPPQEQDIEAIREYWTQPLPGVYCNSCNREVESLNLATQAAAGYFGSTITSWKCPHCGGDSWRTTFMVNGRDAREDIKTLLAILAAHPSPPTQEPT